MSSRRTASVNAPTFALHSKDILGTANAHRYWGIGAAATATTVRMVLEAQALEPVLRQMESLRKELDELRARVSQRVLVISALGSQRFRLRAPLPVEVSAVEGEAATASSPDLEVYGDGDTEYEALDSLRSEIVSSFSFLLESEERLAPAMGAQLARYRELIEIVE